MEKNNACSGCRACEAICPKECIKINVLGRKEFTKIIKKKECTNCHLCEWVCPHTAHIDLKEPLKGFNAYALKSSVIRRSSSGGIASSMYEYCMENSITGIGVLFDGNFNLNYTAIKNERQMRKAAGSKYVYSDMSGIHSLVANELCNGKKVLFIGLPCHATGLLNYCKLKNIDTENLITVDLVCHGVVMPIYFTEHLCRVVGLRMNTNFEGNILFRAKSNPYGLTVTNKSTVIYDKSRYKDEYMKLYLAGMYAKSCCQCKFAQQNRIGDITIKDCNTPWDKRKDNSVANQSSVLINSLKGMELWDCLREGKIKTEEYWVKDIINEDERLQFPSPTLNKYDWFGKIEKYFGHSMAVSILCYLSSIVQNRRKTKRR